LTKNFPKSRICSVNQHDNSGVTGTATLLVFGPRFHWGLLSWKGWDIMKTGKYFFLLAVVAAILCAPALGEVELSRPEDEPILLGRPNPVLAGIDKLCVVVTQLDDEPKMG